MSNLYKTTKKKSDVVVNSRGGDRFYHTSTWRKLRIIVLNEEPLCRVCFENGKITEATVVDHIKQISKGGARFDKNNLQPLCETCHARKSNLESKINRYGSTRTT